MKNIVVFTGHHPMPAPCANCPFTAKVDYLAPGRLDAIKAAAVFGQPFYCHKTVHHPSVPREETEEGCDRAPDWHPRFRQCAGANRYAIDLAKELGVEPQIIDVDPR